MEEVIIFDKSYQERLQEYKEIFDDTSLSVCEIKTKWSLLLELVLDACGWQAIWKIPQSTCEKLQVEYPLLALVYVRNVIFEDLTAEVKILLIDTLEPLPTENTVPLIDLWPTKNQAETVILDMRATANYIDMYKFFYTKVIMPWDYSSNSETWIQDHLEARLRLYYDTKQGKLSETALQELLYIRGKAKRLENQMKLLQQRLVDEDIDGDDLSNKLLQKLILISAEFKRLKAQFNLIENPATRVVLDKTDAAIPSTPSHYVVMEKNTADVADTFLGEIELSNQFHNKNVKISSNLSQVLNKCEGETVIVLSSSEFSFAGLGSFKSGVIKGFSKEMRATLTYTNNDIMFDLTNGPVLLENLVIKANLAQCVVLVRSGKLTIKNCTILGNTQLSTQQGITICNGATLDMSDCKLSGFCAAIIANSSVTLNNVVINEANVGLKVFKANCSLSNCRFTNCKTYGIIAHKSNAQEIVGSFNLLPQLENFTGNNQVVGNSNTIADLIINRRSRIKPMVDLFTNPDLNSTVLNSTILMNSTLV